MGYGKWYLKTGANGRNAERIKVCTEISVGRNKIKHMEKVR